MLASNSLELGGEKCRRVNGVARWVSHKGRTGTATALFQRTELAITLSALLIERSGLARANLRGRVATARGRYAGTARFIHPYHGSVRAQQPC